MAIYVAHTQSRHRRIKEGSTGHAQTLFRHQTREGVLVITLATWFQSSNEPGSLTPSLAMSHQENPHATQSHAHEWSVGACSDVSWVAPLTRVCALQTYPHPFLPLKCTHSSPLLEPRNERCTHSVCAPSGSNVYILPNTYTHLACKNQVQQVQVKCTYPTLSPTPATLGRRPSPPSDLPAH
eukprot:915194-Pelagomonas_calceolata.AAC.4